MFRGRDNSKNLYQDFKDHFFRVIYVGDSSSQNLFFQDRVIPYPVALYGKCTNIYPPKYVVLHVSTNDSVNSSSKKGFQDLLDLNNYMESAYGISVIISEPITRYDNDALAFLRVHHLQDN